MTSRNLILVGGIFHDFQASAEALTMVLEPLGQDLSRKYLASGFYREFKYV